MKLDKDTVLRVFERLRNLKILVVGDVILDRYVFGKVERISPEAPVPVVEVEREEFRLGGAGNVASNLSALGVKTYLVGITGEDYGMHMIKGLLRERDIQDLTVRDSSRPTTEKVRVISMSQQLIRIDRENTRTVQGENLRKILDRLEVYVDGIIISDYAKGVVCKEVIEKVKSTGKFYSVDPRPQNVHLYQGAHLMTPNEKEARQMFKAQTLEDLGWGLKRELSLQALAITLGPKGIALFENRLSLYPARARQVYDVTGAGDTVIAVLTACRVAGFDWDISCELANVCAGIVVGKLGTASPSIEEVIDYVEEGERV
ncbi:MAG: PfkB family carbohydrate kinase [Hydrogenobacter thermophilus]|nr:PfkB family carbohydrate kinase [Hydrogenobacter thermophilus]